MCAGQGWLPALPGVRVRPENHSWYGAYDPGSLCPQVDTAEQSRPASSRDEEPFAGDSLMHLYPVLRLEALFVCGMRQKHLEQCFACVDACQDTEQGCAHALHCTICHAWVTLAGKLRNRDIHSHANECAAAWPRPARCSPGSTMERLVRQVEASLAG